MGPPWVEAPPTRGKDNTARHPMSSVHVARIHGHMVGKCARHFPIATSANPVHSFSQETRQSERWAERDLLSTRTSSH
jgi:hypothetical protein